jgi:hypothetical protein
MKKLKPKMVSVFLSSFILILNIIKNRKAFKTNVLKAFYGAGNRNRTYNLLITSQLLYR